jgi:hypothetical protein
MVEDEQLDFGGDQVLERGGDPAAGFVGCEVERDVFQRVDDDGAGVELFREPGEDGAVFVEHRGSGPRQTVIRSSSGPVRVADHPAELGRPGGAGRGDVEDAAAVGWTGMPSTWVRRPAAGERELLADVVLPTPSGPTSIRPSPAAQPIALSCPQTRIESVSSGSSKMNVPAPDSFGGRRRERRVDR